MDKARSQRFRLRMLQVELQQETHTARELASLADLLAQIETDAADHPLSLIEACDALRPYQYLAPATKRAARAIRRAYDTRSAELAALPAADVLALAADWANRLGAAPVAA